MVSYELICRKFHNINLTLYVVHFNYGILNLCISADDKRYSTPKWIADDNSWENEKGKETTLGFHETSCDR